MSVVIQGIEMPKSCLNCLCYDGEYVCCNITGTYVGFEENRPQDCPLKESEPVVHARWMRLLENDFGWKFACHNCLAYTKVRTKFCPHCGARMDGKDKEK